MQVKLFGKNLFEFNSNSGGIVPSLAFNSAHEMLEKATHLIDFIKDTGGGLSGESTWTENYAVLTEISTGAITSVMSNNGKGGEKPKPVEKPKEELTPKGIYKLKMLNDEGFKMKTDPVYLDEQIDTFKEKLGMIKKTDWDMNRGTTEIASILKRFENRKKYADFKEFYEEFPYTTTARINDLVKEHSYLKLGQVEQFLADMPKEAVDTMKRYTKETEKLCGKKPIYYIIAKKKDFEKSEKRRDPILLAQSPFGHFWQILGAWDEEMLLIEEL